MRSAKNTRILDMYIRLSKGKVVNKANEAQRFCVNERSIQRDIDDIRAVLDDCKALFGEWNGQSIVYDRINKGFKMVGNEDSVMSNSEILAVSKILLESRAFSREDISSVLEKLIGGCASPESKALVNEAVRNEKFHYVELYSGAYTVEVLWDLNKNIQERNMLEISYEKAVASKKEVKRVVEPVSILFSEFYFYLNAYIVKENDQGEYVHLFDYPTVFRVDRIKGYKKVGMKYKRVYANRFEEGEYRKRVQFMQAGRLHKCRFRYTGRNKEAVFDRLPTAILLSEDDSGCVFEAETYGRGIMMWLLSQGSNVEVLGPDLFRERMKQEIQTMLEYYQ